MSHFKLSMSSGRLKAEGVRARLFKDDPDLSSYVSVEKLSEIMCRSILEANVGDLWVSLKAQLGSVLRKQSSLKMMLSNIEKSFFEFANQLLCEQGWENLFEVFSK